MELFLISNSIITLLAIIHNRVGTTSINARLAISSFALLCWVMPFSLVRELFPVEAAVSLDWIVPIQIEVLNSTVDTTNTNALYPTLDQVFFLLILIGIIFALFKFFRHYQWVKNLQQKTPLTPVMHYKKIPVFASNQISNALLVGYTKTAIWINPRLINSEYSEIVLEHEKTHSVNKDNYWLLIVETLKSIYWWNPLVKSMINDITELLEARCDHETSQLFSLNIYQDKLTSLMLSNLADINTTFNSAVVSKNPDIRRLQYLKENSQMNILSKINISILAFLTLSLLAMPISSITALASDSLNESRSSERFSINFEEFPMAIATKVLSEFYSVKNIELDPALNATVFKNFKVKDINLAELSELTNISWSLGDNKLIVSARKGKVIEQLMTNDEYRQNNEAPTVDRDEIGVLLKFDLSHIVKTKESQNKWQKEMSIWSHFNVPFSIDFNKTREIIFNLKDSGDTVLISSNVYQINEDNSKTLVASPKVFTRYGNKATIQIGDDSESDGEVWTLVVDPIKTKNNGIEF